MPFISIYRTLECLFLLIGDFYADVALQVNFIIFES